MKITFFEVPKADQSVFAQSFPGSDVSFYEETLTENNANLAVEADIVSVFTNSPINKNLIDKLPNLKFVATRSTGFNHIDFAYAGTKGVRVSNVPAYGSHTVAEFAFGFILNLSRKMSATIDYVKQKEDFHYFPWMEGFNLEGKTLGVLGTGKIGKNVIKIAKGFEMNVIAFDMFPDSVFATQNSFSYKTFAEVLAQSDIITIHTPYTKENHHLINKENVASMKKGVYLINTARGELIETEALVKGLTSGIIAGAGLDVLESEVELENSVNSDLTMQNHELMKMPNVLITPHAAFFTVEAVAAIAQTTIDNIKGFISGAPINLVK